ncbi:MAG: SAM-dependent methyltransferase [Cytophagales bacterium]|nr:MAG: SAM-dependent methyltransferase [Cytophagales bacterium]
MSRILLIPTYLAEDTQESLSQETFHYLKSVRFFVVENIRTVRRFISSLKLGIPIAELSFLELSPQLTTAELKHFLLSADTHVGVLSEAGSPCIADPGSQVVRLAHNLGWQVLPLAGPCSFIMALMASGFSGQHFSFHAYLPIDKQARRQKILEMEKSVQNTAYSQIFMDTPYRNHALLEAVLQICQPSTRLCVAANLSAPNAWVHSASVGEWRTLKTEIDKIPAVFILGQY